MPKPHGGVRILFFRGSTSCDASKKASTKLASLRRTNLLDVLLFVLASFFSFKVFNVCLQVNDAGCLAFQQCVLVSHDFLVAN